MKKKDPSEGTYEIQPTDIAIIGMSGIFPAAENIHQFWGNLLKGEESIESLGEDRVIKEGKKWVNAKPLIHDVDCFDAPFFKISSRDASLMDPQHRLLLQSAWHTFENAGYVPEKVEGKTGVYLASNFNTYQHLEGWLSKLWKEIEGDFSKRFSAYSGNIVDTISTRVSYKFGLKGPSLTVQSACSSSLVALHLACQSLLLEESDVALAGAVALSFPNEQGYMREEGMILSSDRHCRPFDKKADGTVFGNGVATVLLKPLDKAMKDGDPVIAVIKGSAINNDGSTKVDFNAPSLEGQSAVIERAIEIAGVAPETIGYIEAHGTGTSIGDPIEIAALTKAYRKRTQKKQFCAIGSVKSNIGHLDAASGMAGLIKAVYCLKEGLIPGTLHFKEANPQIDFGSSPFYVASQTEKWESKGFPRRCGVTSLGIGGTNAHVILEELHPSLKGEEAKGEPSEPVPLLFSAETEEQLRTLLKAFEGIDTDLFAMAHTLIEGRKAHRFRLVTFAKEASEIGEAIAKGMIVDTSLESDLGLKLKEAFPHISSNTRRAVEDWLQNRKAVFPFLDEKNPGRVHLPGYPFAKIRYWYDQVVEADQSFSAINLHPLVQKNTSTLEQQKFASVLDGGESFLRDHQIRGKSLLPAAAYMEMARSAFLLSCERAGPLSISGIHFDAPITVDHESVHFETVLYPERGGAHFAISLPERSLNCCEGKIQFVEKKEDPSSIENPFDGSEIILSKEAIYASYEERGTEYGKTFQVMDALHMKRENGKAKLIGKISLDPKAKEGGMVYPPSLLDAAFHPSIGLGRLDNYPFSKEDAFVPVKIDKIDFFEEPSLENTVILSIDLNQLKNETDHLHYDSEIYNEKGALVVRMKGICEKRLQDSAASEEAVRQSSTGDLGSLNPFFTKWFAKELNLPKESLDLEEEIESYGLDSILVVSLTNQLERTFGPLSKTLFFEYRTLEGIAQHVAEKYPDKCLELAGSPTKVKAQKPAPRRKGRFNNEKSTDIAIVGLSGRYPGSNDMRTFWDKLVEGSNLVTEVPKGRWDHDSIFSEKEGIKGKTFSKWGGFIDGFDEFDPLFFKIAPSEAEMMDPQERLFLQTAWEAVEDAGYTPGSLGKRYAHDIGVYVGAMYVEYQLYSIEERMKGNFTVLNGIISSISNRASFLFDFRGPSFSVDTMCSSSLTALYLAYRDIVSGKTSAALVGGVNITAHPNKYLQLAQERMLSKKGLCESFGQGDGGYVPSEGIGCVLLKPLEDALEDGDHIYGVLKGVEINHGGKTNSFTVPNATAQSRVIRRALDVSDISADQISYIEAHGTGTKLGDPIEIQGLSKAFEEDTKEKGFCRIGSLKSNMGHAESAAGIAGLTKVLLQLKHQMLVPSIHSEKLNPAISFSETPFVVQQALEPWQPLKEGEPRYAGLSSFGAGGSNAHVIVEEHLEERKAQVDEGKPCLITLSAKDAERLVEYAEKWIAFLSRPKSDLPTLEEISYTLQVGRTPLEHRLAFVCKSIEEMMQMLEAFVEKHSGDYVVSDPSSKKEKREKEVEKALGQRDLDALAKLFCAHQKIEWSKLYEGKTIKRASLPTYPFAKVRCWFKVAEEVQSKPAPHLHPLIHRNDSILGETRFSSQLSLADPVIEHHRIGGTPLLPGAAYVEMGLAAGKLATGKQLQGVRDVRWIKPLYFDERERPVHTSVVDTQNGTGFEIWSPNNEGETGPDERVIYCQGYFEENFSENAQVIDLSPIKAELAKGMTKEICYKKFRAFDFDYGPCYQTIQKAITNQKEAWIEATLPSGLNREPFSLHPVLLDAAFQSTIAFEFDAYAKTQDTFVPFGIESIQLRHPLTDTLYIRIEQPEISKEGNRTYAIQIFNERGQLSADLKGFSEKPLHVKPLRAFQKEGEGGVVYSALKWKEQAELSQDVSEERGKTLLVSEGLFVELENLDATLLPLRTDEEVEENVEAFVESFFGLKDHLKNQKAQSLILLADSEEIDLISPYLGFFKTLMLEKPAISAKVVLIPQLKKGVSPAALREILEGEWGTLNPMVRYSEDLKKREVLELEKATLLTGHGPDLLREKGIYWCIGGAGGLGLEIAREFATQNVKATLILSGRSSLSEEKKKAIEEIKTPSFEIDYVRCDVSDRISVKAALAQIIETHGTPTGVIHAAGVNRDSLWINKTEEELRAVLSPKLCGTVHLDEALRNIVLDYFLLFSSDSSIMGNVGQTDYAAANSFLDLFAFTREKQREEGTRFGVTKVINWPYWEEGGMRIFDSVQQMIFDEMGVFPLKTDTGMKALREILSSDAPQVMVSYGDLDAMDQKIFSKKVKREKEDSASMDADFVQRIESELRKILAKELHIEETKLTRDTEFEDLGVDSIVSMNLISALESIFGSLPKTLFFEYLTFGECVEFFAKEKTSSFKETSGKEKEVAKLEVSPPKRKESPKPITSLLKSRAEPEGKIAQDIAIIGIAGRYPESDDLETFWANLNEAKNCVREIPSDRWEIEGFYSEKERVLGKSASKWGGFLSEIDKFDPLFFKISVEEAQRLDPQEKLILQEAYHAFEDAGYTRDRLSKEQIGVYIGSMYQEYQLYNTEQAAFGNPLTLNGSAANLSNRISYFFDLRGPSLTLDTMCSSSLTALYLACRDLRDGTCKMALAGGVNVNVHPNKHIVLSDENFVSTDGLCKSFGEGGDGYVPSEGVGVCILKPLENALADGDRIHGVIKGVQINHGGKAKGFTVPSARAQGEVIEKTIRSSGVPVDAISYIEAHGTGTSLGDPIEISGLNKAFTALGMNQSHSIAIGSVKSNIGHCESAAGMAALSKTLLQMKHATLVPSIHSETLNPHIDFDAVPFVVNREHAPWNGKKTALISSFGAGGANACVVIESFEKLISERSSSNAPYVFVLSAKDEKRLEEYAKRLLEVVKKQEVSCESLAYTLQVGREAMEKRLGIVFSDHMDLEEKLTQFLSGEEHAHGLFKGDAKAFKEIFKTQDSADVFTQFLDEQVKKRSLATLVEFWVKGVEIPWRDCYGEDRLELVSLPGYPFARHRCFFEKAKNLATVASVDHPLVHKNASDFSGQRFTSHFKGSEPFLEQHVVAGIPTLPGAAAIEAMARAGSFALGGGDVSTESVMWLRPIQMQGPGLSLDIHCKSIEGDRAAVTITDPEGEVYAQAEITSGPVALKKLIDLSSVLTSCEKTLDHQEIYDALSAMNLEYGEKFKQIQDIHYGDKHWLASLKDSPQDPAPFGLDPYLIDAAFQSTLVISKEGETSLPFMVESIKGSTKSQKPAYLYGAVEERNKMRHIDLYLLSAEGEVIVAINGFKDRPVKEKKIPIEDPSIEDKLTELLKLTQSKQIGIEEGEALAKALILEGDEE